MILYVQLKGNDNVVTDIITYSKEGYQEVNATVPLPDGVLGGWYRLIENAFVFDETLYSQLNSDSVDLR